MGDTRNTSVPLKHTPDGFMSQECPKCERTFKVAPGKGSSNPVTHCPYCNHEGEGCWWTKAQAQYICEYGKYGASKLIGPHIDKTARDLTRKTRGNNSLKISVNVNKPPVPRAPEEDDDMAASITFDCCGETIRHDGNNAQLYCPICGTTKPA